MNISWHHKVRPERIFTPCGTKQATRMERASKRFKAVGDDESDAQQQCQEDNEKRELEESKKEQPQDDGDDRQFPVAAAAKATPELHVDEHESMYGLEDGKRWRSKLKNAQNI